MVRAVGMLDLARVVAASARYEIPEPHPGARALARDACRFLGALVRTLQPRRVLEFGSGFSSVVIARELGRLGSGRLDSIDHSPAWSARAREMARGHGVLDRVELRAFPLGLRLHDGVPSVFYLVPPDFYGDDRYELVLVDGPGHEVGRDGALPEALPRLTVPGWVVLDDGRAEHVQRALARWKARFGPALRWSDCVELGNGIVLAEKVAEPAPGARLGPGPRIGAWLRAGRNLVRVERLGLNRDRVDRLAAPGGPA